MSSGRPTRSGRPTTRGMSCQEINDELENLQDRELPALEESHEWASDSDDESESSSGESSSDEDGDVVSGNEAAQEIDDPSEVPENPEGGDEESDLYRTCENVIFPSGVDLYQTARSNLFPTDSASAAPTSAALGGRTEASSPRQWQAMRRGNTLVMFGGITTGIL